MIESLLKLPSHLRQRVSSALDTGVLAPPYSAVDVRAALNLKEGSEELAQGLAELEKLGLNGTASAAWLRALERVADRAPRPDLVWSGPPVSGLHARDTRRVYEDLLGNAERSIWASTYAFFDGKKAFKVLAERMEAKPDLHVTLLLNIQRGRGDTTAADQLVRRFADRFWGSEWPGSRRPRVFYDPRSLELKRASGVLHAKAVVADEETAFVTSANFTAAALDHNIEMGLLVHDHALALSIVVHFQGLIERGRLVPLPAS